MEYFARALEQQRVMDALVMEYEAHWSGLPPQELEDIPLEDRATCVEAARRNEVEFGRKKGTE